MLEKTYLTEDFSKETLQLRKNLQQQLKVEKERGNDAFIKNNKIIIKGKPEAEKRKRETSGSPSFSNTPPRAAEDENITKGPSKLHKTDAFAYMRARTISLSEKHSPQQKA
ncbi:hypothetical protein HW555_004683 [Spodoptera exigua]|uniref:Uncharacterized protein n=1 Tax=Spodoptera exigua TaxID=7107 RepID=A0A835L854_SPOEX|nr:hypothetical protein HW555_004683 [Spodoptera exigua]